jgi:hypothetical protein
MLKNGLPVLRAEMNIHENLCKTGQQEREMLSQGEIFKRLRAVKSGCGGTRSCAVQRPLREAAQSPDMARQEALALGIPCGTATEISNHSALDDKSKLLQALERRTWLGALRKQVRYLAEWHMRPISHRVRQGIELCQAPEWPDVARRVA